MKLNKYIDSEECPGCEYFVNPYGCIEHSCKVYKDYQEGRAEMEADNEHDRRKDKRLGL